MITGVYEILLRIIWGILLGELALYLLLWTIPLVFRVRVWIARGRFEWTRWRLVRAYARAGIPLPDYLKENQ